MIQHLHREIENLKKKIIQEATLVEENLRESIKALLERDGELARRIVKRDDIIDEMEVEVEEDCLKIFALYQPVAIDLRYIVAFLKLNNDLERIGDLTANIAARAASLSVQDILEIPSQIPEMAVITQKMLKNSLDALIDLDGEKATEVMAEDDRVDTLHESMYHVIGEHMQESPERISQWMEILAISRYLERIADHCTNIAEDVEYMLSGEIHRHESELSENTETLLNTS
ncbi:MAG: phosphate signaling complex protein PhoU [Candidatus Marinimicrobia bacterium]|nr:phosphate signaling complex protein PhoU [Candidatus Neomarinimicrobiota bacterium]